MRREIHKHYLALVSGRVEVEHSEIDAPIGRLGISATNPVWLRMGVIPLDDPQGRKTAEARSEYWRLANNDTMSLLRLQAHTGRLHQLRVHLAHIGHPVIGDKIYGPDANLYLKFIAEGWTEEHQHVLGLSRHALHAHELRFMWNGEEQTFTAPIPNDMLKFVEASFLSFPDSKWGTMRNANLSEKRGPSADEEPRGISKKKRRPIGFARNGRARR